MDNQQVLQDALVDYVRHGWIIVSQSSINAQIKKPKKWSVLLIALGVLLLIGGVLFIPLLAIGIITLLLAVIDYLIKPERNHLLTIEEIELGKNPPAQSGLNIWIAALAIFAASICAIAIYVNP